MGRRVSSAWLIAALSVLTALGVAGSLVPFRPCRICGGLTKEMIRIQSPSTLPHLGCPDCADRGKVPLFRSWMPSQVSEEVAAIIRGLQDYRAFDSRVAVRALLERTGHPDNYLQGIDTNMAYYLNARFLRAGERQYLVLLAYGNTPQEAPIAGALLLTLEGDVLDSVTITCQNQEKRIMGLMRVFYNEPFEGDEAEVSVSVGNGMQPAAFYQIKQWQRPDRQGAYREEDRKESYICRLRIAGNRFEVLRPRD